MLIRPFLLPYSPLLGSHFSCKSFPGVFSFTRSLGRPSTPQPHVVLAPAGRIKRAWRRVLHGARRCLAPSVQNWGWAPLSLVAARPGLEWDILAIPA